MDAFFANCLAVSLSHAVRWMPQVRGKMIKKTGRTCLQSQESVCARP